MASSIKRILCYGDSLTAGFWAGGQKFEPYAKTLKKELESLGIIVEIDHHGFSGWTTQQLLDGSDSNELTDFTGHKVESLQVLNYRLGLQTKVLKQLTYMLFFLFPTKISN